MDDGQGWLGHLLKQFHLSEPADVEQVVQDDQPVHGGRRRRRGRQDRPVSRQPAVVVVCVLTIYFLAVLPAVRVFWLRLMPASRRMRVAAISDEVTSRVGGFVLGNLLTWIVAGFGTWVWLTIFGVPYPLLLALLVALLDLIPLVGSTIAGIVVSLVALTVSLPVAIGTLAFYIGYRFFEDYLLTPRVMRHTVRISPGLTIIATLIGGVLLGLIGALIAIPVAAASTWCSRRSPTRASTAAERSSGGPLPHGRGGRRRPARPASADRPGTGPTYRASTGWRQRPGQLSGGDRGEIEPGRISSLWTVAEPRAGDPSGDDPAARSAERGQPAVDGARLDRQADGQGELAAAARPRAIHSPRDGRSGMAVSESRPRRTSASAS